jgi:hypothetical protein
MRTIHKAVLNVTDEQIIVLPKNSLPISVGEQRGALCLWYGCNTDEEESAQYIVRIFGTGNPIPYGDLGRFLGTVPMADGALIWHVFVGPFVTSVD